ncbi:putative O-methyltransferase [Rubrobacter radiotolerans]|uniref:O-methyltransferase n=1 Tax=Rubrobacter radiotolerans TaxID=42256 RepID=A0A023X3Z6_RUBRA|nr:O-methyltransferase [Rubrobacter radiotolerans]AHY47192.1 putative O-methyltransferase [Rubrobacter radiotolerans]MDX5894595.1 O-methyltransferase [Rubrobacter radiotolerans]SMC06340.1 caffeoyl-CoA O-methyltransferase [Rubrobacter radiotolerans DSM 5868]
MAEVDLREVELYIEELFVREDPVLQAALRDAREAGLPEIQVSPLEARLLYFLTALSGAERVLEVGTLGGYSGIHFARALPPGGKLVTLELEERHAAVARESFRRAGLLGKVEVRVGDAKRAMREMARSGEEPFDLVFIDAEKEGYAEYLDLALALSKVGTLILADNAIQGGSVLRSEDGSGRAIREFNAKLAGHERLEGTILPLLRERVDGLALARVVR